MKILKIFYTLFITLTSSIAISYADIQIASPTNILPGYPDTNLTNVSVNTAGDFIGAVIAWMIGLTAVLTVLAITWAWIQMILAIGEEEKMKKARHTMIYAFIGLIIAWLAYAIVTLITYLNLDNFI